MTINLYQALDIFTDNLSDIANAARENATALVTELPTPLPWNLPLEIEYDIAHGRTPSNIEELRAHYRTEHIKTITAPYRRVWEAIERRSKPKTKDSITPENIEAAKEYPITDLLEFNRARKTLCLWHGDTQPSLHYYPKSNTVHCFVCEKNADSIDIYMHMNNVGFVQAVKQLS